jgi:hypothetical protein
VFECGSCPVFFSPEKYDYRPPKQLLYCVSFSFKKYFPDFNFLSLFFFLVFLFIYDEEKRPFGEHKISGSI